MEITDYEKAYKLAKKEESKRKAKGENPFLDILDEIPGAVNSVMEYPLGLVQIPTELIVGTKTAGRSNAFAHNFMPLLDTSTEFARKWEELCKSHLEEGIRDPIKAYEYMNKFYVLEGNKRVSVLKYFDAVAVPGNVTRIIPYRTEEKENQIYYEFMDFYRLASINYIWFSEKGRFARLQLQVGKRPDEEWNDDDRMEFNSAYVRFSKIFEQVGKLRSKQRTIGDVFLEFLELYGYDQVRSMSDAQIKRLIQKGAEVYETVGSEENVDIRMNPEGGKATLLKKIIGSGVQNIAFVHEVDPKKSGWTYAHDLGRMHIEQVFGKQIKVQCYIAKEFPSYEEAIEKAIRDGNAIVFTTSPVLYKASLKLALDYPAAKILNCSLMADKGVIRNYNARMYEAKFLIGAIAGAMAEDDKLGYVADYPIYGTIANANAFALGAKMVNPRVQVYLEWMSQKSSDELIASFRERKVSLISGRDLIIPGNEGTRHFGLFETEEKSTINLAMPIWNWGKFYEEIVRSIMNGTWKNESVSGKALNYWWGMSSGIIDVVYSHHLPVGTRRLAELLKKTICTGEFNPFSGIIYAQDNKIIQGKDDETLTSEKIIKMDWLCENIIGNIPKITEVSEKAKEVVQQQGVQTLQMGK